MNTLGSPTSVRQTMGRLNLNIEALKFPDSSIKQTTENSDVPSGYSPLDYHLFLILNDYLQPDAKSTIDQATERILDLFPYTSNLQPVNTVVFELAEQIPFWHPSHPKLARLLWFIGRNGRRVDESDTSQLSAAINAFYQQLWENLMDSQGFSPSDDAYAEPIRYVNFQAFLANLEATGILTPSLTAACEALDGAFAPETEQDDDLTIQEAWIMGAAQWILWNGQGMFRLILFPETDVASKKPSLVDWNRWAESFSRVSAGKFGDIGQECEELSRKASRLMGMIKDCVI